MCYAAGDDVTRWPAAPPQRAAPQQHGAHTPRTGTHTRPLPRPADHHRSASYHLTIVFIASILGRVTGTPRPLNMQYRMCIPISVGNGHRINTGTAVQNFAKKYVHLTSFFLFEEKIINLSLCAVDL